jgi:Rrf2 family protein
MGNLHIERQKYLNLFLALLYMLSKKTKYAIKALVALGKNTGNPPMQIVKLAEMEMIPRKFLEQILLDMRNAGYLYSKNGAGGGYSLNKDPKEIFLADILRITDGPIAMVPCASLKFYRKCDECHDEVTCGIRKTFIDVRDATLNVLAQTSIADVIAREQDKLPAF